MEVPKKEYLEALEDINAGIKHALRVSRTLMESENPKEHTWTVIHIQEAVEGLQRGMDKLLDIIP